jgi:hypothetical protein
MNYELAFDALVLSQRGEDRFHAIPIAIGRQRSKDEDAFWFFFASWRLMQLCVKITPRFPYRELKRQKARCLIILCLLAPYAALREN